MSGMTKVGAGAKLEDSNIALYGSKDHKDAKLNAAKTETAWEGAGKAVGLQIWRIEKFKVVHWPKEQYGKFYDGDSYICLWTYKHADSDKLLYNVHFWLGEHTSQDEAGTAAYKTVELDDLLGDLPVQYREVQGSESDEFNKLFKQIEILKGGVDSGFNKVKPEEYKPRLFHFKGSKTVRVSEVDLKVESLNEGDVFILDAGLLIYQWNGKSSSIGEKRKAAETVEAYKKERNGKPKSQVIDHLENDEAFWKFFGGKPTKLAAAPLMSPMRRPRPASLLSRSSPTPLAPSSSLTSLRKPREPPSRRTSSSTMMSSSSMPSTPSMSGSARVPPRKSVPVESRPELSMLRSRASTLPPLSSVFLTALSPRASSPSSPKP